MEPEERTQPTSPTCIGDRKTSIAAQRSPAAPAWMHPQRSLSAREETRTKRKREDKKRIREFKSKLLSQFFMDSNKTSTIAVQPQKLIDSERSLWKDWVNLLNSKSHENPPENHRKGKTLGSTRLNTNLIFRLLHEIRLQATPSLIKIYRWQKAQRKSQISPLSNPSSHNKREDLQMRDSQRGLFRGGFPQLAHSLYIDTPTKDQNALH